MTTITLEVPDSLAPKFAAFGNRLPDILAQTVDLFSSKNSSTKAFPVYEAMMDFLASGPSPEKIIAHHFSADLQTRLEELLNRNREGEITTEELAELDAFEQVNDVMSSLKLRARRSIQA
jgi:deoxyadenosine/deoxycytidine kinase